MTDDKIRIEVGQTVRLLLDGFRLGLFEVIEIGKPDDWGTPPYNQAATVRLIIDYSEFKAGELMDFWAVDLSPAMRDEIEALTHGKPDPANFQIPPERYPKLTRLNLKHLAQPALTPSILGSWVYSAAPFVEGEKVLRDWLERVGGIVYTDGANKLHWGYWAQSNRNGFEGIPLYPGSPSGEKTWSTFAQFLEFALEYARQTIQIDGYSKGYSTALIELGEELIKAGVNPHDIEDALASLATQKQAEIDAEPDA